MITITEIRDTDEMMIDLSAFPLPTIRNMYYNMPYNDFGYLGLYFKEVRLKSDGVVHELVDGVIDHPEVGVVPALLGLTHTIPRH